MAATTASWPMAGTWASSGIRPPAVPRPAPSRTADTVCTVSHLNTTWASR